MRSGLAGSNARGFFGVGFLANQVVVVQLKQLALFADQLGELGGSSLCFAIDNRTQSAQLGLDVSSDVLALSLGELDRLVEAFDLKLNVVGAQVLLAADPALSVTAHEVVVGATVAGVPAEGHSPAAFATVDRALEIVAVLTLALAADALAVEHTRDTREQIFVDEWLMTTWEDLVSVADLAGVVRVAQDRV